MGTTNSSREIYGVFKDLEKKKSGVTGTQCTKEEPEEIGDKTSENHSGSITQSPVRRGKEFGFIFKQSEVLE